MLFSIVLVYVITGGVLALFPDLLTTKISEGVTHTLGLFYLKVKTESIFNIIFAILKYVDLIKEKIPIRPMIPVLIMTLFHSFIGVLFSFLILSTKMLNLKNKQV